MYIVIESPSIAELWPRIAKTVWITEKLKKVRKDSRRSEVLEGTDILGVRGEARAECSQANSELIGDR